MKSWLIKKKRVSVMAAAALVLLGLYALFVYPIKGVYRGPLLRAVSGGETKLVLTQGTAYVATPSHPMDPIGSYHREAGRLILRMHDEEYWIKRTFGGIKLVHPSNVETTERFWKVGLP